MHLRPSAARRATAHHGGDPVSTRCDALADAVAAEHAMRLAV
ncbi:MAG TPA: hypothetical protein VFB42_00680 [Gaiellaceae bacterium]|nr:hypothetical protein [Gaiellaceae bacterium]